MVEVETYAELVTSQPQTDYAGLEGGVKIAAIHFLGFVVWEDLSEGRCDVEWFGFLIDQEISERYDSPKEGLVIDSLDYEIVY